MSGLWLKAAAMGLVAGIDNLTTVLAMGALLFAGPLAAGAGPGVGVIMLGGALLAFYVAWRSVLPWSISLVQESTIAVLAAAVVAMTLQSDGDSETLIATAIALMGASSVVTAIVLWVVGRMNFGRLLRFLPHPVVAGALAGTGWLLIDGAFTVLTGVRVGIELPAALAEPAVLWRVVPAIVFTVMMFAVFSRFTSIMTVPLVMAVAVAAFYLSLQLTGLSVADARALGHLPMVHGSAGINLPSPGMVFDVDWWAVAAAWPSLLIIAGLNMVVLTMNLNGLELAIGRDIDINRELRTTGIANLLSGAVGGSSGFTGVSMTILAHETGAPPRLAGYATAIIMLIGLFLAGSLVIFVPMFMTTGFLMFLGAELVRRWLFHTRATLPTSEWIAVAVILMAIAALGFVEGLAVGLLVSVIVFVFNYSRLPVVRFQASGAERRSMVDRSPSAAKYLSLHGRAIEIIQLQGYLFFGTADHVVDLVRKRLAGDADFQYLIIDFSQVSGADSAAVTCFVKIRRLVAQSRVTVYFTGVPPSVEGNLVRAGMVFGRDSHMRLDTDVDHALEKAEEAILAGRGDITVSESLQKHLAAAIGDHPRIGDLIAEMTRMEMEPGDVLIKQGDDAGDVFFLATGRVKVQVTRPDGQVLRLRTMLGGAIVGEIAHYLDETRTADVVVEAPSVIFRLGAEEFATLEREDAELATLAHRLLAINLSEKLAVATKLLQATQR